MGTMLPLAAALTLGTGLAWATPATGAPCSDAGVGVVVDPGSLGGAVAHGCAVEGGGLTAAQVTDTAGFEVTFVQGTGFVCRVAGRPGTDQESCRRTPPADAYWGLFWAEDADSPWAYATLGAAAMTIPEGGVVGWRWQDGGSREEPPGVGAPAQEPSQEPSQEPAQEPGAHTAQDPAADPTGEPATEPATVEQAGTSVPAWAAAGAVVLLGAAVGAAAWRRRG